MDQENQTDETLKHCVAGAAVTTVGAFVGGLAGGPVGMAVGGTVAAVTVGSRINGKCYRFHVEQLHDFISIFFVFTAFNSLRPVIACKVLLKKFFDFTDARWEWLVHTILSFVPDFLKCNTKEERMALVKCHIIIPGLTKLVLICLSFIIKQLPTIIKHFH